MIAILRPSLMLLGMFSLLTGVLYPALVTTVAQLVFPKQANGSLIRSGEQIMGSDLIGQPFSDPKYFWGRPSATAPHPYNAGASSGSNLGPTNPALHQAVRDCVAALRAVDPGNQEPVPIDLVTASASGLDPHISPAAALYQAPRVARVRGLSAERVRSLVADYTEHRILETMGEPRVNVLKLNLALDRTRHE